MARLKVGTLLLVVALLTSGVAAANFYVGREAERAGRLQAEDELQKVRQAKEALEQERDELTQAKQALEQQAADLGNQAKTLAEQVAQEKRAKETLTLEVAQARKEAKAAVQQKALVESDLAKAKLSYQQLSSELTTLRQAKEALEKRVKEMLAARAKEAEQIVVTPSPSSVSQVTASSAAAPAASIPSQIPAPAPAVKGAEGKVLVVNREYDFVVISMGSKDAVKKGSRFAVFRGNKQILTVEVEKVYENMSAANMLEEEKKGTEVQEGDLVRLIS